MVLAHRFRPYTSNKGASVYGLMLTFIILGGHKFPQVIEGGIVLIALMMMWDVCIAELLVKICKEEISTAIRQHPKQDIRDVIRDVYVQTSQHERPRWIIDD